MQHSGTAIKKNPQKANPTDCNNGRQQRQSYPTQQKPQNEQNQK